MNRFVRTFFRAPSGVLAAVTVSLLALLAVIGPLVWGATAAITHPAAANQGVSALHWLGTDQLGRDVAARTLAATRLSLLLALAAAGLGAVLGFPVGALAAVCHPRLRKLLVRLIDVLLAFPGILTALVVSAVVGPGPQGAVLAIGVSIAPTFARIASTLAASVGGRDYVAAGRVLGFSPVRLLLRHVLPNIAETLSVFLFNAIGLSLVLVSSLSFLGLGVQAPTFDWGRMLIEGAKSIYVTPAAALAPAAAIALTGLAMGFVGEAIARALNPVLWTRDESPAPGGASMTAAISALTAQPATARPTLLEVANLSVRFPTPDGAYVTPVDDVSFTIAAGEMVGVVGESGSGKSMTLLAIAQLVSHPGKVEAHRLHLNGHDVGAMSDRQLGDQIAMVFQDPMSALNPALRVGVQLAEAAQVHSGLTRAAAMQLAAARLDEVHLSAPQERLQQYPHEFSGGMRQRAMIAMGLMNEPALIMADEPTTALDVTVQAEILGLLQEVNRERQTAVLLVSHDMGVITGVCSRVLVMYAGRVVEDVSTVDLLVQPRHPYTQALLAAVPDVRMDRAHLLATIPGQPPELANLPAGCAFAPRCPLATERCHAERPALAPVGRDHAVACWVAQEHVREWGERA